MAFNNPIRKSIHISSDHRIWDLSDPSLCGIWLLCMAEIQKILSGSNLLKTMDCTITSKNLISLISHAYTVPT